MKKLGAMGLLGVIFPPEYGGAGLGYVDYVLAIEELSAVDGSIGITIAAHNSLGTNHIFIAGNEEQKKKYMPRLAGGEWLAAWGLTEPGSGSDARQRQDHRGEKGRSLCAEWKQDLHHQRALRKCCGGHCGNGQEQGHARAIGVCGREGHAGIPAGQRRRTSWALEPAIPANLFLRTAKFRRKTCWARKARASSMRCGFWMAAGFRLPRWRWGLEGARWMRR
jgi:hypothetical protein